jgi:hypothetical protein
MSELGRQTGEPLVVDLTDRILASWTELWDALTRPCGLPAWFGRNLNAWWDTIDCGGTSNVIDDHPRLAIRVRATGMFRRDDPEGQAFAEVTNRSVYASLEVESDSP